MGQVQPYRPTLLLLGAFSRHPQALEWARERAVQQWGPVALASELFDFRETDYYERSMGTDLKKVFFLFSLPFDPAMLVETKLLTNEWEEEYRDANPCTEARPLNLDPGYLTEGKLVLASTKDHNHRLYMARGIYAEVTLNYQRGGIWRPLDWTYPDYRRPDYHEFFTRCRNYLREHKHEF